MHVLAAEAEYLPTMQMLQLAAPEFSWYEPAGHSTQDDDKVAPVAVEKRPESHVVHTEAPLAIAYLPAEHAVHKARAEVAAKKPSEQAEQDEAPAADATAYRPALQSTQEVNPADEYLPAAQLAQLVEARAATRSE